MNTLLTILITALPLTAAEIVPQPGERLQDVLLTAKAGDTVLIPSGNWTGNLCIDIPITLRGEGGVLDGLGKDSVITVTAPGVVLENLIITGSGVELRGPDSGIYVTPEATGTVLRNNHISNSTFGIWIHETHHVTIANNRILGTHEGNPSQRGNGIQLFDAKHLIIRGNHVTGGRDGIYISATEDSLIQNNLTEQVRYGIHYMYSYDNRLIGNTSRDNLIGFALMQSRNLLVTGNRAERNDRHALLFRDAQYCTITDNVLLQNGEGLFFFSSTDNVIRNNTVAGNAVGAKIWAGSYDNEVVNNRFLANARQIFYVGTEDLVWGKDDGGNIWSDYIGWDQDGDGYGDRPYRVDNFTGRMVYSYPAAGLLAHSPAFELLTYLERVLPVFRVPTVVDEQPKIRDHEGRLE